MKGNSDKWLRIDNPIMWAVLASTVFLALLIYLGRIPTCNADLFPKGECPAKWRHIVAAPINEVGDTLAGLAGVLAFIWLVATVLLQAHELREQRKEFREQRLATQDMASSMKAQSRLFEDERLQRESNRLDELFSCKIKRINFLVRDIKQYLNEDDWQDLLWSEVITTDDEVNLMHSLKESISKYVEVALDEHPNNRDIIEKHVAEGLLEIERAIREINSLGLTSHPALVERKRNLGLYWLMDVMLEMQDLYEDDFVVADTRSQFL